jgi:hypothetical protein
MSKKKESKAKPKQTPKEKEFTKDDFIKILEQAVKQPPVTK